MHSLRGVRVQRFRSDKCQVRGIVVDTTLVFYQIAKAFLIVAIYTLQFVKALQTLLSRSKPEHSVHMQFVTWIL